jgi:hypothetical protein
VLGVLGDTKNYRIIEYLLVGWGRWRFNPLADYLFMELTQRNILVKSLVKSFGKKSW